MTNPIILSSTLDGDSTISNIADLNNVIAQADNQNATSGTTFEIELGANADIELSIALQAINLASGVTLDIVGNGATLDGKNESTAASYDQRGLFVYSGAVVISNLTVANTKAVGGNGGLEGGGGGAGLGGGLFVAGATNAAGTQTAATDPDQAAVPNVTLNNVTFTGDSATGGNGGSSDLAVSPYSGLLGQFGGGGGLGGAGGNGSDEGVFIGTAAGGGGIGGAGGNAPGLDDGRNSGQTGIVDGIAGGGGGGSSGSDTDPSGAGGGIDASSSTGGFGGGGAGVYDSAGRVNDGSSFGGFGGGGGGAPSGGGGGGFGGGGGGGPFLQSYAGPGGGPGGFGAGSGGSHGLSIGGGGGGLGAGGDIFVQQGATLTIEGTSTLNAGTAAGGSGGGKGGSAGAGYGGGIFLQGNEALTFAPTGGQTETISGVIADMTGSNDPSGEMGAGSLIMNGAGTLVLSAHNTFTGGIDINSSGTVNLTTVGAGGTGTITFATGTKALLDIQSAALPTLGHTNMIANFGKDDEIQIVGPNWKVTVQDINSVPTLKTSGNPGQTYFIDKFSNGTFEVVQDSAPVTTVPGAQTAYPTAAAAISGISVADSDAIAGNQTISVTLSDTYGDLSATAATGGTVTGSGTATLTVSGTLTAVNTELGTLSYLLPSVGTVTSDTIKVATTDGLSGSTSHTIGVTINEKPLTATVPGAQTVTAVIANPVSGISVADPSPATGFTVVLSDTSGELSASAASGGSVGGSGTTTLTLSGTTLTAVNTELASVSYLLPTYGAAASDTIDVTASDNLGFTDSHTIGITVNHTAANEAALNTAIGIANALAANSGTYEIDLLPNTEYEISSALTAIDLQPGVTLDIEGNGATLDGTNESTGASYNQRGLFVYSGVVNVNDLTIQNTVAQGSNGVSARAGRTGGGGGGGGLGGGLFVAGATTAGGAGSVANDPGQQVVPVVTLDDVNFGSDAAKGGNGVTGSVSGGGGGSLGVSGIDGFGAGGSGGGLNNNGTNGGFGGGGGAGAPGTFPGGYGANGGFGGGGGGGGFGGGAGGFGGGSGVIYSKNNHLEGGGGGLGAGGDIFVQQGGTLIIDGDSSLAAGTVGGGSGADGAQNGAALGQTIFLEGHQSISFAPAANETETVSGTIADAASGGLGAGSLIMDGAGTLVLSGNNTLTGGITIDSGTVELSTSTSAGTGTITFAANAGATLQLDETTPGALLNGDTIDGFASGDTIDLAGIAYDSTGSAILDSKTNVLEVIEGGHTYALNLNPTEDMSADTFRLGADGTGTAITVIPPTVLNGDQPVTNESQLNAAIAQADGEAANSGVVIIDIGGNISLNTALDAINLQSGVTLDIQGSNFTLDGGGGESGLFIYSGAVNIKDLTIANTKTVGGNGGAAGGGGGAGLGGGLFVAGTTSQGSLNPDQAVVPNVTLDNVSFSNDSATGGAGGAPPTFTLYNFGGGGGLDGGAGGNAGNGNNGGGGGGGIGSGAQGGVGSASGGPGAGGNGIVPGAGDTAGSGGTLSGFGPPEFYKGGHSGGGGGGGYSEGGGGGGGLGGGAGGTPNGNEGYGGDGGFGGGGGGAYQNHDGGEGGFGGGGGAGSSEGGSGGFGGGGGGSNNQSGAGGFGGGDAASFSSYGHGGGGGGLGAGGDIFVQQGAQIVITGGTLTGGAVEGGAGGPNAANGSALGGSLFFQVASGQTDTVGSLITDGSGQPGQVVVMGSTSGTGGSSGSGGTLLLTADNTYSGGSHIDGGATLEIGAGATAGTGAITFGSGELQFSPGSSPTNEIDGFGLGDTIQVDGFKEQTANYWQNTLWLHGTDATGTAAETVGLNIPGLLASNFAIDFTGSATDISYGTNETDVSAVACYCRGTLIEIGRGQKKVETLNIGDKIRTASGALRPIKWIGRRSYGGRFIMGRPDILPICFKVGSLAENVPKRDLWISPHHAMYLSGVLIEARDLINGFTIVQAEHIDTVEYFHVELETHDVIIAEGALSETFIDDNSRGMFHNAQEYRALYPDTPDGAACYCAPRCKDGYEVETVRRQIARRAGLRTLEDEKRIGTLRGYVDLAGAERIAGWAQNIDRPEAPVCLDIYAAGRLIGQVLANRYREDLALAGLGSGNHSFEFTPPCGFELVSSVVEVRRSLDGTVLSLSASAQTNFVVQRPKNGRAAA